jgi:hypothetical protein
MIIHVINPLIQFGKVDFDILSEDPDGTIPEYRFSSSLPMDPIPDKLAFVEIVKAIYLGVYLQTPEEEETLRTAMAFEYYRPLEEHILTIDRPESYPTLGA